MSELSLDSTEGYFEQLRQIMIFGETWVDAEANTIRYRPDEYPWDVIQPGGRGWGKATALVQWIDEMAEAHAAEEAMLAEVADRALLAADAEPSPAVIVRWACDKPTVVLDDEMYAVAKLTDDATFGDLMRRWLQLR